MGVLDRLKAYQRLSATVTEGQAIPLPSETAEGLASSQDGAILPPGNSFLQQFILEMLKKNNIPVAALKFIPGFGEQVNKLLYGDPYEAHTFFADMHYQVARLLDQDSDWDPVEVARKREYAEAEERAKQRNRAILDKWNEDDRTSAESTASGSLDGIGPDGQWQEHTFRPATFPLHDAVSAIESADSGQQAEI